MEMQPLRLPEKVIGPVVAAAATAAAALPPEAEVTVTPTMQATQATTTTTTAILTRASIWHQSGRRVSVVVSVNADVHCDASTAL